MNTAALMTLVATILGVQGPLLLIALGSEDGLRRGDPGSVYYEVANEGDPEAVLVGLARIVAATGNRSVLLSDTDTEPISGQLVRFEIPSARIGTDMEPERLAIIGAAVVGADVDPCLPMQPLPGLFGDPMACLTPGRSVEVLDRVDGWILARSDGLEGWMAADSLVITEAAMAPASEARDTPGHASSFPPRDEALDSRLADVDAVLERSRDARQRLSALLEQPSSPGSASPAGGELEPATESVEDLRQQLRQAETDLAEAEAAHEELSRHVIAGTVSDLEKRLENAETRLREAEIERRTLSSAVEDLSEENESLRVRLATAETLRDEAIADVDRMRTRVGALDPVSPSERQTLEAELERRNAEISRLEEALAAMQTRLGELETDSGSPETSSSAEEENSSRTPRWKFWKRNRTPPETDPGEREDRPDGSDEGR